MKIRTVLLIALVSCATSSFACDYHGGMNFGAFGQFHPLAQRQALERELAEISIVNQDKDIVKSMSDEQIELNYFVPLDYTYAEVTLSASDDLVLSQTVPYTLMKTRGSLDVPFRTKQPGKHFIFVHVDAKRENKAYSRIHRIAITSS